MLTLVSPAGAGRRRVVGALAGLAIGSAAFLVTGTAAEAAESGVPTVVGAERVDSAKAKQNKIPAGARKTTRSRPTVGANGPRFQNPVAGTGSPRIVGGQLADPAKYPGVVGIETFFLAPDETGEWVSWVSTCTGTVLSSTKVLTAAHCTIGFPFASTYVIAGRSDLDSSGGFVAQVGSTWTDQDYNYADPNATVPVDDVSVLTLKDALPSVYTPVSLTPQGDQSPYAAGTQATIVGYGVTNNTTNDAGVLHEATVPMQSDSTCSSTLGPAYDQSRMICAGGSGADSCHGDSGGPILVGGVQAGIVDWGVDPCASAYGVYERLSRYSDQVKQDLTRPAVANLDWSGDGHSDLLGRNAAGDIIEVDGSGLGTDGFGGIMSWGGIGRGWQGYTKLFRVTNWNGDGTPSIMARDSSGRLFQYATDGAGSFTTGQGIQVGSGWNMFTDIMVTNNWTGDGRSNLMGRNSKGELFLYTSDGHGGWLNGGIGIKIGTGWNTFNTVLTPGAWAGDGHQALIGRNSAGDLLLYKSDGHGGWLNGGIGVKIGTGWGIFKIFMSPGDWNGDRQVDLLGITPGGVLSAYKTDGHGAWLDGGRGQQIDTGWNIYNAVF